MNIIKAIYTTAVAGVVVDVTVEKDKNWHRFVEVLTI